MQQKANGLYDPRFEHDNCGIGAVVNIKGNKDHEAVEGALGIVEHLEHRAGKDAEGKTGDGVGILLQISISFLRRWQIPSAFHWEMRENTVSECFSSHRMNYRESRQ